MFGDSKFVFALCDGAAGEYRCAQVGTMYTEEDQIFCRLYMSG